ncbi:DUF1707 SHOCT-like domain-containing protein [Micromonosporaceae bacterium DT55]|uniref:DUF1707 SHOCT-like domain-containing protein n=1 Tax=Melissospora conviva TaxID=3388432 RepID=UPI003C27F7E4
MELERHDDHDRIRVSDAEREQVVELLGQAATEGRLTLDEYADRATTAHAAKTRGELAKLTDDLPVVSPVATPPVPFGTPATREKLTAIFGSESRKGIWRVPEVVEAKAVFGDCRIELQEAHLQHRVTTIEAEAIFGDVTIVVPEGMDVRMTGKAIFGDKRSKLKGPVVPGSPVIEVHCNVIFGEVTVRPPRKPWW